MVAGVGKLQGVWADLLMPLDEDLSINHKKLYTHVQTLAAKGVRGLVLFGRCGEGAAFTPVERVELIRFLRDQGVEGKDMLLNASAASMPDTVHLIRKAQSLGVQSFMLIPPYPEPDSTDQGLVEYFSYVVQHLSDLDLQLYLASQASPSASDLNPRVINELLTRHAGKFHGLIDQSPNASHTLDWIRSFASSLAVYTTHDMNAQVVAGMGIHTGISSYVNLITKLMVRVVTASEVDKKISVIGNKIGDDDLRLNEFDQLLTHLPLVPALKYLLSNRYHDPDWLRVRPPLSALNADSQEKLDKAFKKFNLNPNVY
jgi:4-hydroxy-tetrahydrodipicolinate synthase